MKKTIIGMFLAVVFAALPFASSAITVNDVQTQIDALLAQIQMLQEQLVQLTSGGGTVVTQPVFPNPDRCYPLDRVLRFGHRGDDVRALQERLQEEGLFSGEATGYFGAATQAAVQQLQANEGIVSGGSPDTTGYGMVGPRTSQRIWICDGGTDPYPSRLHATPREGSAPLWVSFETRIGGLRMANPSYLIDFGDGTSEKPSECYAPADACMSAGVNKHLYQNAGTYVARLLEIDDACRGATGCMAPVSQREIASVRINVRDGVACPMVEYQRPLCGEGEEARPVNPNGQCPGPWQCVPVEAPAQCRVWFDGCNTCSRTSPGGMMACTMMYCFAPSQPVCREYFDGSSSNKPPVISGFTGPTVLYTNQSGTWKIDARDPENQSLSYQIHWGDVDGLAASNAQGIYDMERGVVQNTTFTHAYSTPGTYTISITVRDTGGQSAVTTTTVRVEGNVASTDLDASPKSGNAPLIVTFTTKGTTSSWMNGNEMVHMADGGTRYIDFGDGQVQRLDCPTPAYSSTCVLRMSHTYNQPGTYIAKLFVAGYYGVQNDAVYGTRSDIAQTKVQVFGPVAGGGGTACTAQYAPVCGEKTFCSVNTGSESGSIYPGQCALQRKTYSNECFAQADGASIVWKGSCEVY
ncbi:MAG: peptidoglycan-binding protein [Candidatus Pacebacteria bacterium]|nr:peptidoglycan-binding protein [Candidatus Paceibacterota bacterium]